MASELIEIRVAITSRAHKFLTRRALRLGRVREEEAGRILTWAIVQLIAKAREGAAPRTYTQQEFDAHMAALRRSYESQIASPRQRLEPEREAADASP